MLNFLFKNKRQNIDELIGFNDLRFDDSFESIKNIRSIHSVLDVNDWQKLVSLNSQNDKIFEYLIDSISLEYHDNKLKRIILVIGNISSKDFTKILRNYDSIYGKFDVDKFGWEGKIRSIQIFYINEILNIKMHNLSNNIDSQFKNI